MSEAVIYARSSKDREDQTSTARQEADARDWAKSNGLRVVECHTDIVSGYRADARRPAFDQAVAWTTEAAGRTLIVWKLDRLCRRGMGQVGLLSIVSKRSVPESCSSGTASTRLRAR